MTFSGRRLEQTNPAPRSCVVVTMYTRKVPLAKSTVRTHDACSILEAIYREATTTVLFRKNLWLASAIELYNVFGTGINAQDICFQIEHCRLRRHIR